MTRYSALPFPPYAYLPGRTPHPRTSPLGHGYGRPEPRHPALASADWASSELYRFGVDLFNARYYWECHEAFEALWRSAAKPSPEAQFFQGLIQVAAAHLKRELGEERPMRALAARGLDRLEQVPSRFFGLDVARFASETRAFFAGESTDVPALTLGAG